jgi:hypothetical protein
MQTTLKRTITMKPCLFFLALLAATCLLMGFARPTTAGIIVEGSSSKLGVLDPSTGTITVIGSTSVMLYGLGFDNSGSLYGLGADKNLYAVNSATASLSQIGAYTGNFNGGAALGGGPGGTLYSTNGIGDLWTVNAASGAATYVGNMGIETNSNPSSDGGSGLFITAGNDLYRINPSNSVTTLVGPGSYGEIFGLAYTSGTMYAIEAGGSGVYALNLGTGQSTLVSNYDNSVIGGVYAAAAIAIPEPSSFVIVSIAIAISMVNAVKYRSSVTQAIAKSDRRFKVQAEDCPIAL